MFGKKRRGPDTYATDTEQLRFDERFRGAGESELSALQAEEAELRGTGNYASAEESPPPPPSTSDDDPARRQRVSDGNLDAAAEAAVAAWDEEERGEEEKIRPITFEYDHVQAAAELEAEERQRFSPPLSLSLAFSPSSYPRDRGAVSPGAAMCLESSVFAETLHLAASFGIMSAPPAGGPTPGPAPEQEGGGAAAARGGGAGAGAAAKRLDDQRCAGGREGASE